MIVDRLQSGALVRDLTEELVHGLLDAVFQFSFGAVERALLLRHIRLLAAHSFLEGTHRAHEGLNHSADLLCFCLEDVVGFP